MKKEGSLKLILSVLIIVLLTLVSLGGVYLKDKNILKNKIPDYKLGMELDTDTIIKLDVLKEEENTSETKDETNEENVNENNENQNSEETNSEEQTAENNGDGQATENNNETPQENIYTAENYKKVKKILESRLNAVKIEQYTIRLDENSGEIVLEVPTDTDTNMLQNIFVIGKTEIRNTKDSEVIVNYEGIKNVNVSVDSSRSYGDFKLIKIDIEFTKDAINKFKEVKNAYSSAEANLDGAEDKIELAIDGSSIYSSPVNEFLASATLGSLSLQITDDSKEYAKSQEILKEANLIKNLMENEPLPVKYTINYTNDVHSNINSYGIIAVFAVLLAVMLVFLFIKFKAKGVLALLSILGFISTLLLVVRYTNVQMSIASIVSLAVMTILEFVYLVKLLLNGNISKKIFNNDTIEFSKMLIPAFIISLVIAFGSIIEISGLGMVIFWGIILFEVFNNILVRAILTNGKNK